MTVVDHYGDDEKLLAAAMSLCSDAEEDEGTAVGEPTECALVNYAHSLGLGKPALKAAEPRVGEAPFDSMRKMMSTCLLYTSPLSIKSTKISIHSLPFSAICWSIVVNGGL